MKFLHRCSKPNLKTTFLTHLKQGQVFVGLLTGGLILGGHQEAIAQVPITSITASPLFAPAQTINTTGAGTTVYPSANNYNLNFGTAAATNKNLVMTNIGVGGQNYNVQQISNYIGIQRRVFSNSLITTNRHIMLYERVSKTGTNPININLAASFVNTMEEILLSNVINRGADNVFANRGDSADNNNNIERIDMITTSGLTAPSTVARLSQVGFMVLDRNGNDRFKIAAIRAINPATNQPTALGPLVNAGSAGTWGPSGYTVNTTVIRRDGAGLFQPSFDPTNQSISGTFISYATLGVGVNDTIYGYALFPTDVDATMDLVGLTNVPSLTDASQGGLDLLAGGLSFAEYPTTDLAVTKTDGQTNALAGSPITYTITVTNNGSTNLTSLKLRDTLPTGLLNPVFTPSSGTYNSATEDWTGVTLPAGGSIQLQVSGTIDPSFSGVLQNTVEVFPPNGFEDFNASNNRATDTTIVNDTANPRLRLVKRVTAIRGTALNSYIDLVTTASATEDNLTAWGNLTATAQKSDNSGPTSGFSAFLRGVIDTAHISLAQQPHPGDIMDYTVYFLADGGKDAQNVMLCDFIPANTTYVRNSLQVAFGTNPALPVSDLQDGDGGFYDIGDLVPTTICQSTNNSRGAVRVNLGTVNRSLGSGTPNNSYGFFRFQVRVD
jgi:uncharacterized repeat protein (TIGR01451 family)